MWIQVLSLFKSACLVLPSVDTNIADFQIIYFFSVIIPTVIEVFSLNLLGEVRVRPRDAVAARRRHGRGHVRLQ